MRHSLLPVGIGEFALNRDAAAPVLEVLHATKRYPTRALFRRAKNAPSSRPALNDISLEIREGEMVGLLGPNGAGKTTLLKTLSTLIEVDQGSVRVLGFDVTRDPRQVRGLIGLVTCDERSFYWRLSGQQNLEFFAALYRLPRQKAQQRIELLLERLGLADAAHRPYHSYSSGMRQKLAIARGLLSEPRLVLYDEPTRSLDPLSAQNVRQWISENRKVSPGTTHLIATNQLQEAEDLCDRVVILNHGEIVAQGSTDAIRKRFGACEHVLHRIFCKHFALAGRLAPTPDRGLLDIRESQGEEPGVTLIELRTTQDGQALSFVLNAILRSGGVVLSCETEKVPFDEVFIALVRGTPIETAVRS